MKIKVCPKCKWELIHEEEGIMGCFNPECYGFYGRKGYEVVEINEGGV